MSETETVVTFMERKSHRSGNNQILKDEQYLNTEFGVENVSLEKIIQTKTRS